MVRIKHCIGFLSFGFDKMDYGMSLYYKFKYCKGKVFSLKNITKNL